jgi:hypothetical protein
MEIIVNTPNFFLHLQDSLVLIQLFFDGVIDIATQFEI